MRSGACNKMKTVELAVERSKWCNLCFPADGNGGPSHSLMICGRELELWTKMLV